MLRRVQPMLPEESKVFDVAELENDIEEQIRRMPHPALVRGEESAHDFAPPAIRNEHTMMTIELGKLTAAAVQQGYENASKEFEALGVELTANVERIEATKADTISVIKELHDLAAHYREEGKRIAAEIENHASLTMEASSTAKVLKEKIAGNPA